VSLGRRESLRPQAADGGRAQIHTSIAVSGAFPGSGATTAAVALADSAANQRRSVEVIELASPTRSGLVSAADAELGLDAGAEWIRARRGDILMWRLACPVSSMAEAPPLPTRGLVPGLRIVDTGWSWPDVLLAKGSGTGRQVALMPLVLVSRATVPGIRRMESLLRSAATAPAAVVIVGPTRWAPAVEATVGASLRELDRSGRVVRLPSEPLVEIQGITPSLMPKKLVTAARKLLALLLDESNN
jgi:hypothetical protein